MRWGNWIKITVGWLAVGLVMGACGGKDRAAEQTGQVPAVSAPSEAPTVAEPATVDLDGDFWFAGFHVTLNGAAFDPASSSVTVEATFENLGPSRPSSTGRRRWRPTAPSTRRRRRSRFRPFPG